MFVLSSRALDFSAVKGGLVEQLSGEPSELVRKLAARGINHLYIDGGLTIQRFLSARLVDRLIVTRVPVLIGKGIALFGELPGDLKLEHVQTRTFEGGLVQSEYSLAGRKRSVGS